MISAVILTKNEERTIRACIQSVLWCDEIVVIDDHSNDTTVALAKNAGALVYFHDVAGDFAAQRNFALQKARGEWVLFIDADERVSEALQAEIKTVISSRRNRYAGYFLRRTDYLWGKALKHGETAGVKILRLGRKEAGVWSGAVHEVWKIQGHRGELTEVLQHYPHQSVKEFLSEINYYTDLRAHELYKQKVKSSWWSILLFTKGKFFQNYVLKLGILDGIPGIISAVMMSFHSFLVRSKLWLLWQKR
jgi:glycosyltransferase involved in cell wall biosynthesis